jgi:hypothetical protein
MRLIAGAWRGVLARRHWLAPTSFTRAFTSITWKWTRFKLAFCAQYILALVATCPRAVGSYEQCLSEDLESSAPHILRVRAIVAIHPKHRRTSVVNARRRAKVPSDRVVRKTHYCPGGLNLFVADLKSSSCARISSSSVMPLCSILVCFFSRFCGALAGARRCNGAHTCCVFL